MVHTDWYEQLQAAQARIDAMLAETLADPAKLADDKAFLAGELGFDEYMVRATARSEALKERLKSIVTP